MILPKKRTEEIDSIIQNLSISTGIFYPKNTLEEIAESAGAKVIYGDLSNIGNNISGAILYEDEKDKKNPTIYINSENPITRRRFTLAHELGHLFLHNGKKLRIDNLNYFGDDSKTISEETEANYFAASLLMPKDNLLDKIDEGYTIQEIAEYFGVSEAAAGNRIKWIKKRQKQV